MEQRSDRCFIVAELSCNHMQRYDLAVETVKAMKTAGADAVKLSIDDPDGGITIDSNKECFKISGGTPWDGKTLYQLYKNETYTPWDWHSRLMKLSSDLGMIAFSTPSCKKTIDFLESIGNPIYKIASFEITDIGLVEYAASKMKPIMISTGIASLVEIEEAVAVCRKAGNEDITLLKCVSTYPSRLDEINLKVIPDMRDKFNVKVGLSDHSLDADVAVAAVALGACVVEKHFILDRKLGGPDAEFSMMPDEFSKMASAIRSTEKALGRIDYTVTEHMERSRLFSRSLFVVEDMKKGDIVTERNVRSIRPGHGLHPRHLKEILGKRVLRDLEKGTPFCRSMIN